MSFVSSCRVIALASLAGFVLLAGCGDPPSEENKPAQGGANPGVKPKAAELSNQMVAAVSAGRNSSAISVHFALGAPPAVATPLPVQIAIVPHQDFAKVRAHFESQDGLAMHVGEEFGPMDAVEAEKSLSHQLVLLPGREGLFMVTVSVETVSDDGDTTRIFSIPVIVGPAQAAAAAAPAAPESPNPPKQ